MGCGIEGSKKIKINYLTILPNSDSTFNSKMQTLYYRNNNSLKISKNNWLIILNFLQYKELKEIGKVNRQFNYYTKDNRILIKFFQKKEDDYFNNFNYENKKYIDNYNNYDKSSVQKIIDGFIFRS